MRECCEDPEDFNDGGDEDNILYTVYCIHSVMLREPVVSSLGFDKGGVGQVRN